MSSREMTHNLCGIGGDANGIGGCQLCHCHYCTAEIIKEGVKCLSEAEEARSVARDFFATLRRCVPLEVHDAYLQEKYPWLKEGSGGD